MKQMTRWIREFVLNSPIVKLAYKARFYVDVGVSQVNWFSGKLPEIMAAVYLLEKFGFVVVGTQIIVFGIILVVCLLLFGYFWKKTGLYDVNQYVVAQKDPVQAELLEAARLIKKKYGGRT